MPEEKPVEDAFAPITIHGHECTLSDGRSVWAGQYENSWYVKFVGPAGETRLRLSFEGAIALVSLLDRRETKMLSLLTEWMLDAVDPPEPPKATAD